jgi:hypothetical protein
MRLSLFLACATLALADDPAGPFAVHITGKGNSSIDGEQRFILFPIH